MLLKTIAIDMDDEEEEPDISWDMPDMSWPISMFISILMSGRRCKIEDEECDVCYGQRDVLLMEGEKEKKKKNVENDMMRNVSGLSLIRQLLAGALVSGFLNLGGADEQIVANCAPIRTNNETRRKVPGGGGTAKNKPLIKLNAFLRVFN